MAKNATFSNAARTDMATAIEARFNTGYLRIYTGAQPAGPDTAIGAQTLLAELRFAADAVATNVNGLLTFAAMTEEDAALADGVPTWYRAFESDGVTAIHDGTVGTADANLILAAASIVTGVAVEITSFTIDVKAASAQ